MRIARLVLATSLVMALVPAAADAGPMQVDVQALFAHPDGRLGDVEDLSDAFDLGFGFRGGVMFGVNDYLYLGGHAGWYRSPSDQLLDDFDFDVDLDSYPVHGLVQLRAQKVISLYAQAGAGITHQKISGDSLLGFEGSQTSFSWLVGGGVSIGLPGPIALVGGVDYTTISHGDGDLWGDDDDVKFWLFSAGLRFHTD